MWVCFDYHLEFRQKFYKFYSKLPPILNQANLTVQTEKWLLVKMTVEDLTRNAQNYQPALLTIYDPEIQGIQTRCRRMVNSKVNTLVTSITEEVCELTPLLWDPVSDSSFSRSSCMFSEGSSRYL